MRLKDSVFGLSLVSSFALLSAPASAERVARLAYVVDAQDGCPDEASFRALVTARLGRDPFHAAAEDRADVGVRRDGNGLSGRLTLRHAGKIVSDRSIRAGAGECDALVEALAAVAGLAIDPDAAASTSRDPALPSLPAAPPAPAAPPKPTAAPLPEVVEYRPAHPPAQDSRMSARFAARGAFVGSAGILPGPSLGGDIGVGFGLGHFVLFAEGRGETTLTTASGAPADRLEGSLITGGLAPCGVVGVFIGCLVGRVGALQGRAPDAEQPNLGSSTVAFLGVRAAAHLAVGSGFAVVPQLELIVPIVRTTLVFDDRPAWTASPIAGSLGLGLMYVSQ